MTIKELSGLYILKKEIALLEDQLSKIKADIDVCKRQLTEIRREAHSGGIGSPVISDMPKGPQSTESVTERAAMHIVQAEERLQKMLKDYIQIEKTISNRQARCVEQRSRLEAYIDTVDDDLIRTAMSYRFVSGFSWNEVAAAMGGKNRGESVKQAVSRYIRTHD